MRSGQPWMRWRVWPSYCSGPVALRGPKNCGAKEALEWTLNWYQANMFPANRLEHVTELARAAEAVGRRFEAHCWWELAAEQPAHAALARTELARLDREAMSAGPAPSPLTPAGLLAELNAHATPESHAPRASSCGASPWFVDDAEPAGLRFTFDNGLETLHQMPETMSGGLGLLDYDGDGWLDVYLVQGGKFPPSRDAPNTGDRLFRNKGDGTFEDVSVRSRITSCLTDMATASRSATSTTTATRICS